MDNIEFKSYKELFSYISTFENVTYEGGYDERVFKLSNENWMIGVYSSQTDDIWDQLSTSSEKLSKEYPIVFLFDGYGNIYFDNVKQGQRTFFPETSYNFFLNYIFDQYPELKPNDQKVLKDFRNLNFNLENLIKELIDKKLELAETKYLLDKARQDQSRLEEEIKSFSSKNRDMSQELNKFERLYKDTADVLLKFENLITAEQIKTIYKNFRNKDRSAGGFVSFYSESKIVCFSYFPLEYREGPSGTWMSQSDFPYVSDQRKFIYIDTDGNVIPATSSLNMKFEITLETFTNKFKNDF